MRIRSIRMRLTVSIAALLAIFVAVSASAVLGLVKIDRKIETVDRKWLAGAQLLADLKTMISEFRVSESYRFLALDQPSMIQAEFLAERQAAAIGELINRCRPMAMGADVKADFAEFDSAWNQLLASHRAWVDEAAGAPATRSIGYGSPLQKRYEAVQLAANNLIADARTTANAEAAAADAEAARLTLLVAALSIAAGLVAIGLMVHAEFAITRPLAAITSALVRLAEGDRAVRVPELHRHDEIGAMAKAFEVFRRNADALADAQERAEALSRRDALTGLANRRLFSTRLQAALLTAREGLVTAVLLIDLDRFKPINDVHGHATGDGVLCTIAARLRELSGIGCVVARLGGDEFAVILPPAKDVALARRVALEFAGRIVDRLGAPIEVAGKSLSVGASLGIAVVPDDGNTAEAVLRAADLAMYHAKNSGRGTVCVFEPGMDAHVRDRAELEADLRAAIAAGDIQPFYQPVVELASGRIAGYEVLARWRHPRRGFVPPDVFIPLLEQIGALTETTDVLLRRALADARDWEAGTTLAINASPRQLQDAAFPAFVASALMAASFPPGRLEVEITETALLDDFAAARGSLEALRALGVRVVLDDFGTGYSSLAHLRELKFDKIKIDRSFVGSLADNADCDAIVDAVLNLAGRLGMEVVAEGIETAEIAGLLEKRCCALGQGYLFSAAVPAADVAGLSDRVRRAAA